jgi:hypothetical protein
MILGLITLFIAVTISVVAAYYSILGLTAIFAAAFWPIVVMGGALEAGKIMATIWLHKNWERAGLQYKLYLVPAVILLMFLTSMGIFGFLSKAHIDQTASSQESVAQVERIGKEVARQQDIANRAQQTLTRLESTGTGADANVNNQIKLEQERIDSSLARIQPAIDEQQRIIDTQTKLYQDEIKKIDDQLAQLQRFIDAKEVDKAQAMVGTKADGNWGPGTAAAVRNWQARKQQERQVSLAKLEEANNNPTIRAARDEIARVRKTAEAQVAQSNQLIDRLRQQLGKTNQQELATALTEQQQRLRDANTEIDRLTEQKYRLEAEYRKLEAEVGPVKYIAEFIYGDQTDKNLLEHAVRWVILLIVVVFDPLALVLILAATKQIEWVQSVRREKQQQIDIRDENAELVVHYRDQLTQLDRQTQDLQQQITQRDVDVARLTQTLAAITAKRDHWQSEYEKMVSQLTEAHDQLVANVNARHDHEVAQAEYRERIDQSQEHVMHLNQQMQELTAELEQKQIRLREQELELIEVRSNYLSLDTDFQSMIADRERALTREHQQHETIEKLINDITTLKTEIENLTMVAIQPPPVVPEAAQPNKVVPEPVPETVLNPKVIPEPEPEPVVPATEVDLGFGIDFPDEPNRGDLFLRVDFKPSRLFKWNDMQWIQVSKHTTDSYLNNPEYIDFLIDKLRSREYDWDDLNAAEQEQINLYTNGRGI